MADTRRCPGCQSTLPPGAPEGLCGACAAAGADPGEPPKPESIRATIKSDGRPVAPSPAELAEHFPQLEIIELLGQGGMGYVYKARQVGLDRLVALKLLPPHVGGDRTFAERFAREARALARLSHAGIVTIHDSGEVGGLYYFVMEYIDGLNLRQLLSGDEPIDTDKALRIVGSVCDALDYAHDEGVIHRDIKPENILLDKKGRVKIADFGLAKLLGGDAGGSQLTLTAPHLVMGTPHYMAPEQTERPSEVDHRADIYSLGVVLYEMITGELPLGRFPLPSEMGRGDARLDRIILRALQKDPDRRFQRASDVKTAVAAALSGAPPAAFESTATTTGPVPTPADSGFATGTQSDIELQRAHFRVQRCAYWLHVTSIVMLVLAVPFFLFLSVQLLFGGGWRPLWNLVLWGMAAGSPILMMTGSDRMKRLESRGLAIAACISWLLPISPCWIPVTLPLGIWGLVVLTRPQIAAAFDRVAAARIAAQPGGR